MEKTAVLALNPVNGSGLFQYLEAFYENGIPYTVFAVADTPAISTNSGLSIQAHDVVAHLKGREDEFDALVFACGDAMPKFSENASASYNQDMMAVIKTFGEQGKLLIGHCGAGLLFEMAGLTDGKKLAVHPYVKGMIGKGTAIEEEWAEDGNLLTAQTENSIAQMIDRVVERLK